MDEARLPGVPPRAHTIALPGIAIVLVPCAHDWVATKGVVGSGPILTIASAREESSDRPGSRRGTMDFAHQHAPRALTASASRFPALAPPRLPLRLELNAPLPCAIV